MMIARLRNDAHFRLQLSRDQSHVLDEPSQPQLQPNPDDSEDDADGKLFEEE